MSKNKAYNTIIEQGSKNFKDQGIAVRTYVKDMTLAGETAKTTASRVSQLGIKAKAASVGMKALAVAGNLLASMGIMAVVSGLITVISGLATAEKDAEEMASQLGESLSSSLGTISSYKEEISSLNDTINSSSSSYSESKEARERLMEIQSDLIKNYGDEAQSINSIKSAINGEVDALDQLSAKEYTKSKNAFNSFNDKGWLGQLTGEVSNFINGYNSQMDRMIDEVENYTAEIDFGSFADDKELKKVFEQFGFIEKITSKNNHTVKLMTLDGNVDNVYDTVLNLQQVMDSLDSENAQQVMDSLDSENAKKLSIQLGNIATNASNVSEQYKEMYNNYILYEKIWKDDSSKQYYERLTEAYEKYKNATNDSAKSNALKEFQNIISEDAFNKLDENVQTYLTSTLYPDIKDEIGSWLFKFDVEANDVSIKKLQTAFDQFGSTDELLNFDYSTSDDAVKKAAYQDINAYATKYKVTLEQLVAMAEDERMIANDAYNRLVKLYGEQEVSSWSNEKLQEAEENINKLESLHDDINDKEIILTTTTNNLTDAFQSLSDTISNTSKIKSNTFFDKMSNKIDALMSKLQIVAKILGIDVSVPEYSYQPGSVTNPIVTADNSSSNFFNYDEDSAKFAKKADEELDYATQVQEKIASLRKSAQNEEGEDKSDQSTNTELYNSLLTLADAGELTVEAFMKNSDAVKAFGADTGDASKDLDIATEAVKQFNKEADNTKQLASMKTGIKSILSAYDEKKDSKDNRVGADTLSGLYDGLKIKDWDEEDLKVWEKYKDAASSPTTSLKQLKKAQDDLATSFVNNKNFLADLNDETKDYTQQLLTEMGVTNAEDIVMAKLIDKNEDYSDAKFELNGRTIDLCNSTVNEISQFSREAGGAENTKNALLQLALKKKLVNGTTLDFSGDIENIKNYVKALGGSTTMLDLVSKMKKVNNGETVPGLPSNVTDMAQSEVDKVLKIDTGVETNGGNPNSKDKSSSSGSKDSNYKATRTVYDWIEKRITYLTNKADELTNKIEKFKDKVSKVKDSISDLLYAGTDENKIVKSITDKATNTMSAITKAITAEIKVAQANAKAVKRYQNVQAAKQAEIATTKQVQEDTSSMKIGSTQLKNYQARYGVTVTKGKNGVKKVKISKKEMNKIKKYIKKMQKGQIGKNDIEQLSDPVLKAYLDEYMNEYDKGTNAKKAVQDAIDKINSLHEEYRSMANEIANAPIEVATKKVEQLSNALQILQNKAADIRIIATASGDVAGNYTSTGQVDVSAINANTEAQVENVKQTNATLNKATNTLASKVETSKGKVDTKSKNALSAMGNKNNKDKTGLTAAQYKKLKNILSKGKKEVPADLVAKIKDTNLAKKVEQYNQAILSKQEFVTAYNNAKEQSDESNSTLNQDILSKYEDGAEQITTAYENQIATLSHGVNMIQKELDMASAKGNMLSKASVKAQKDIVSQEHVYNVNAIADYRKQLQKIEDAGGIYSSQWYAIQKKINEALETAEDDLINIVNYEKQINDIVNDTFDRMRNSIGRVTNELQLMLDVISDTDNFNPITHLVTEDGISKLQIYNSLLNTAKNNAQTETARINSLKQAYNDAGGIKHDYSNGNNITWGDVTIHSDEEYQEQLQKLYDQADNYIKEYYSQRKSIIEWEKEALENEKSIAQDLVDATKETLSTAKDLHDYQKSIKEKTDNISTLQTQIAALSGNGSEDAMARMQSLQKQLMDSQQDLQETEYDRYISDLQSMYDKMMAEYSDLLTSLEADEEAMFNEGIKNLEGKEDITNGILQNLNNQFGYTEETNIASAIGNTNTLLQDIRNDVIKIAEKEDYQKIAELITKANDSIKNGDLVTAAEYQKQAQTILDSLTDNSEYKNKANELMDDSKSKYTQKDIEQKEAAAEAERQRIAEEQAKQARQVDMAQQAVVEDPAKDAMTADEAHTLVENAFHQVSKYQTDHPKKDILHAPAKKRNQYAKTNQWVYDKTKGSQILSSDGLSKFAEYLGVKQGKGVEELLHKAQYAGFSTGGLVEMVHRNGDDGLATLKNGEAVFTPAQTKTFTQEFMPAMDSMIDSANWLKEMATNAQNATVNNTNSTNNVEANYSFNLENVTNAQDMIKQIQSSTQLQDLLYDATVGKSLSSNKNRTKLNKY